MRWQTEFLRSVLYVHKYFVSISLALPRVGCIGCACAFERTRTTANLWTIYCNSTLAHTCRRYHRFFVYTYIVCCAVLNVSVRARSLSPFRTHKHSCCVFLVLLFVASFLQVCACLIVLHSLSHRMRFSRLFHIYTICTNKKWKA